MRENRTRQEGKAGRGKRKETRRRRQKQDEDCCPLAEEFEEKQDEADLCVCVQKLCVLDFEVCNDDYFLTSFHKVVEALREGAPNRSL